MSNLLEHHFSSEHEMVLAPGHVEEAMSYMAQAGRINLSFLQFEAEPYPELSSEDGRHSDGDTNGNEGYHREHPDTLMDIVIFELPTGCSNRNCVLTEVGIGRMEDNQHEGGPIMNMCRDGRLIVDGTIFQGHHLQLRVPAQGEMRKHLQGSSKKFDVKNSGRYYEVMLANCNKEGRMVNVEGQVVFEFIVDDDDDAFSYLQSLDPADRQYLVVSATTFILLVMCFFRVRYSPRNSTSSRISYRPAMQDVADVEMSGGGGQIA